MAIRAKKRQEDFDVIGYTDFDEMLKDENIHSVHICTPHYLHYEMIVKALDAGKTVVSEKPVTMTREQNSMYIHRFSIVTQDSQDLQRECGEQEKLNISQL